MAEEYWNYIKYDEDFNVQYCPANDPNGEITGKHIMFLKEWFDENPKERMRLGWIKYIRHNPEDLVEYDPQTQYVINRPKAIDEYTIEDAYVVMDKSEEQLLLEDMLESLNVYIPSGKVILDAQGGVIV